MHVMPPRDQSVTSFDVTDSSSDIIKESMINMKTNYYNRVCGDVRKFKIQNSSKKHYSQMLYYEEDFNDVCQIYFPRTLPNDNQVLNTNTNTKFSSIMKRSNYQNTSTNATKNLLTKKKVTRLT